MVEHNETSFPHIPHSYSQGLRDGIGYFSDIHRTLSYLKAVSPEPTSLQSSHPCLGEHQNYPSPNLSSPRPVWSCWSSDTFSVSPVPSELDVRGLFSGAYTLWPLALTSSHHGELHALLQEVLCTHRLLPSLVAFKSASQGSTPFPLSLLQAQLLGPHQLLSTVGIQDLLWSPFATLLNFFQHLLHSLST